MMRSRFLISVALAAFPAAPALAQTAPMASPTPPSGFPPPVVITLPPPGAGPVAVPTPETRPTPAARATPTPRATPTSRPTPRPTQAPAATPTPRATPRPAATPTTPPPTPVAAPGPMPSAPAIVAAPPQPAGTPAASQVIASDDDAGWLLPVGGGVAVAALAGLLLFLRRTPRAEAEEADVVPVEDAAPADPTPAAPPASPAPAMFARPAPTPASPTPAAPTPAAPTPSAPSATRAWLAFTLQPRRAGVNLLTATLDAQIVVRNEGDAPAQDIRLALTLLSAGGAQEEELGQLFAAPVARPAATPFALAPGEERVVTALATLPRGAINVLSAGGREMFVPLAAVNLRYVTAGAAAQTAQAYAIGIERAGAAKLAPFRLDTARMHEAVAARPHALALRS